MDKRTLLIVVFSLTFAGSTLAQGNDPFIFANEHGVGSLTFFGLPTLNMPGIMAADPGPGGLPSALTYNLLGPPALVAGDLFVQELIGSTLHLSDVIRFNPDGTSPGYTASFVFYSEFATGIAAPADTGFPTSFYANTFTVLEIDQEVFYIPNAGQTGYVPGFSATYHFVSDDTQGSAVPEPATASLVVIAIGAIAIRRRRRPN
jgi:hypothetical protein